MHFFSLLTNVVTAGLVTGSLAAPSDVAENGRILKRSLKAGQLLPIVQSVNQQANAVVANINQALIGVGPFSPPATKSAASKKVIQHFGTLTTVLNQGLTNITRQASNPPALAVRQGSPGTNETRDLINALGQLVTLINTTIIQVVSAIGLAELVPPITSALGVLSNFFLSISAVVIDFLPFLGPIGTFLQGVGSVLSGVGQIIPGP